MENTPFDKAQDIFVWHLQAIHVIKDNKNASELAKIHAIITVDQIIDNGPFRDYGQSYDSISSRLDAIKNYWKDVKTELENLKTD